MNWRSLIRRTSMKPARRKFLAGMLASLFVIAGDWENGAALARIHGGIASGAVSGLLTTITLVNTSGSTQATNFISPIFGHPFVQGQIPAGTCPVFQLTNGTNVPFSVSVSTARATWPDGSLKHASFMLRVPTTIAGSGSLVINVLSGGAFPSNSSRTTADYTSGGLDLNISGTGLDGNASGVWVTNLGQGVTAANSDNYKFMDGAAGRVDRIRASFRQSSADHGYLECYWYMVATQDVSGNLGGIRYLPRITQPWYNTGLGPGGTNVQMISFSALTLNNSASLISDLWGRSNPTVFSYHVGPTVNVANDNNLGGACIRLTTTGTLDTALALNTSYFYYQQSPTFAQITVSSQNPQGGGVNLNNNATGTQTMTAYPYVPPGCSIMGATSTGTYRYVQGGGSFAADSTVRVQFDRYYIRQTKMVLPYNLRGTTVTSTATTSYYTNCTGPVQQDVGAGGGRRDIGVIPAWHSKHLYTQATVDELNVRVSGLVGIGQYLMNIRNKSAGGTIPCGNNGHNSAGSTYSGMMAPSPTFSTVPGLCIGTVTDTQHIANLPYYPFLITGEPQYLDSLFEWGNFMCIAGYPTGSTTTINGSNYVIAGDASNPGGRNVTTSGTTRYGCCFNSSSNRSDAWRYRNMGCAAAFNHPECAGYNQYMNDLVAATADMAVAVIALAPTGYASTNGLWLNQNSADYVEPWEQGYWIGTALLVYNISSTTSANLLTAVTKTVNWWDHVTLTATGYCCIGGEQVIVCPGNTATPALISNDDLLGCIGPGVTWVTSSANFTLYMLNSSSVPWIPAIGDKLIFSRGGPSQHNLPIPAAFTAFTPYYILSVSGSGATRTITLTATKSVAFGGAGGGTAITNTDSWVQNTGTGGSETTVYFQPGSPPAGGCYSDSADPVGFLPNMRGNFLAATANGITVSAGAQADLNSRWSSSFATDPGWDMTNSYAYTA